MARRKRIPYDPPHLRKGKRGRSGPPPRPEQIFLTRRMFLAKGIIVSAFTALAGRLGYLQLVEGQKYRAEAESNITKAETIKATRGVIYDRLGRELARNEQTWEVRVRPADLPEDAAARARVLDQLINALNLPDALVLDPTAIPEGAAETVYARTAQLLGKVLTIEPTDEVARQPFFEVDGQPVAGQVIRVNGDELQVYVYPDALSRLADWAKITADQRVVAGIPVPPDAHFAGKGNVLTILFTIDDRLVTRVQRAIESLGDLSTRQEVLDALRGDALNAWTAYINTEKDRNYLVLLDDDLTTDLAALCRAHLSELPGVKVMNRLEYLVENGRSQDQVVVQTGVPRDVALKLEANRLYLPGVELDGDVLTRHYTGGEAMSHILGYVSKVTEADIEAKENRDARGNPIYDADDVKGQDGIERVLEEVLRGRKGSQVVSMDISGNAWRVIPDSVEEPVPGRNVTLTIDLEFQRAVSEILQAGIRFANDDRRAIAAIDPSRPVATESGAGSVVAIDPRNGEVLAMVSYPHYDNQLFVDGISQRKYDEYVSDEANKPLLDRALRGLYPPGSTLKPFMALAGLHEKKLDTTKTYYCGGAIRVPFAWDQSKGNTHRCWIWRQGGHQGLDVYGALEQSCDVFFYNVGAPRQPIDQEKTDYLYYRDINVLANQLGEKHYFEGLGIALIKEHLSQRFWFGEATGIDLPTEADGVVPDEDWLRRNFQGAGWSVGDTIITSIGQGYFLTTPLQLALNVAAVANAGTIFKPQLIREIFDDERTTVQTAAPTELRKLGYQPEIVDVVREGMRRVVHGDKGTARINADGSTKWPLTNPPNEPEITLAGKTGTAEIGLPDDQGNYERQHAWFTAFAPFEEPEIAVAVLIEDGGEGSSYAVPVADRVIRAYLELTNKRPRGQVLRPDGAGARADESVLAPSAAFPAPGSTGNAGIQGQD